MQKKALQSGSATGKTPAKAYHMAGNRPTKQSPTQAKQQAQLQRPAKAKSLSRLAQGEAKQVRTAAPEQQHRAPSKKRAAPTRDMHVVSPAQSSAGDASPMPLPLSMPGGLPQRLWVWVWIRAGCRQLWLSIGLSDESAVSRITPEVVTDL